MKKYLIIPITLFLHSCGSTSESGNKQQDSCKLAQQIKITPREILLKKIKGFDTLTPNGNYLHYALDSNNSVTITLGNNKLQRVFKNDQFPEPGIYTYKNEWKNFVGMQCSCGNSCWTLTLLPLTKKGKMITYDYDLASDTKRNLLFHKKHLEGNEYYVTNILTRKKKKIVLPSVSGNGLPGNGIDSMAFVKEGLYIKWETGNQKGKCKSEIFKLNI